MSPIRRLRHLAQAAVGIRAAAVRVLAPVQVAPVPAPVEVVSRSVQSNVVVFCRQRSVL